VNVILATALPFLLASFVFPQCVVYEDEILVCGGLCQREYYSYNLIKDQYKKISDFPFILQQHCVVNCGKEDDQVKLLSISSLPNHILITHYKSNKKKNNNLLFITTVNEIGVIDLHTNEYIDVINNKCSNLSLSYHLMPKTKQNHVLINQFLLFSQGCISSITYHENTKEFTQCIWNVLIYDLLHYGVVCLNDAIVILRGTNKLYKRKNTIKMYDTQNGTLLDSQLGLPFRIYKNDTSLHIIGGSGNFNATTKHYVVWTKRIYRRSVSVFFLSLFIVSMSTL
ncbi:hypothetical protein RFI_37884, partial [Reticulomyxa filosa]